ncbi:MAG: RNA polymerase sigma factor [Myxococcaceae bacterium]|nr:RNA polymerase sigma factor [Myxococcaceae bacterium]
MNTSSAAKLRTGLTAPKPLPVLSPRERAQQRWLSAERIRSLTGQLYAKHKGAVTARLMALGLNAADAEEVCTETFVVAMRKLPTFEGTSTLSCWLHGIARKLAADHRRTARARHEQLVDEVPDQLGWWSVHHQAEENERARAVRDQVAVLKPGQRDVVQKFCLEEQPMTDYVRQAGLPLHTAYARLYAAQGVLRGALAPVQA